MGFEPVNKITYGDAGGASHVTESGPEASHDPGKTSVAETFWYVRRLVVVHVDTNNDKPSRKTWYYRDSKAASQPKSALS